jgi:DNA repair exonuclease SbcCD ATPase subunit
LEAAVNRDIAVTNGKIAELDNMHELNIKYIEEEATQKRRLMKEQEMLQKELDHKSKLRDEELKQCIKEKERSQVIELQNKLEIGNAELEYFIVSLLITSYRIY